MYVLCVGSASASSREIYIVFSRSLFSQSENKYLGITKLQPIGPALDFCPVLSEASQVGNLLPLL